MAFLLLALTSTGLAQIAGFQGAGPLRGVASDVAGPPYNVRWTYKVTEEGDRASIDNNPVILGGIAYVADSAGTLHAIDLKSGQAKWKYKAQDGFATTPLIVNNRIYLGDMAGMVHCVSLDKGEKVWVFDGGGGPIHASCNASPDGKLIIFGNDSAQLFAVSADKGEKVWEGKSGDRVNACPAIAFDAAFFCGCDARLIAINLKDGTERFGVDVGGLAPGSPAILDDRIILGNGEGNVIAFSPDGKQTLWKYSAAEAGTMFYSSPAVADGIAVIGCWDGQLYDIEFKLCMA
jgi:outer membrane protein assembly factor BamB